MKLCSLLAAIVIATPAQAYEHDAPPTRPYPFQRSVLTPRPVGISPYRHVFRVRVYNTPRRQPYYNVPPYPVLSPY